MRLLPARRLTKLRAPVWQLCMPLSAPPADVRQQWELAAEMRCDPKRSAAFVDHVDGAFERVLQCYYPYLCSAHRHTGVSTLTVHWHTHKLGCLLGLCTGVHLS